MKGSWQKVPLFHRFALQILALGHEALSPSIVNNLPSPISTRTPTPSSAALPSRLPDFKMPADEERTTKFRMGPSKVVNSTVSPSDSLPREKKGRNQIPSQGDRGPSAGRLKRLIVWLKIAASRLRKWGR